MFCKHCGNKNDADSKFCRACGLGITPEQKIEQHFENIPSTKKNVDIIEYAGFWIRLSAYLIDQMIISIFVLVTFIIYMAYRGTNDFGITSAAPTERILYLLVFVLYYIFFLSCTSSTPGKRIYGLRVVDSITGKKISFFQSIKNSFGHLLSSIFGLGYLPVITDKNRHQAFHDSWAGDYVERRKYNKWIASILLIVAIFFILFLLLIASDPAGLSK